MEWNLLYLTLCEQLHLINRIEHLIRVIFLISAIALRLELLIQFDFQREAGKAEILFLRAAAHLRPSSFLGLMLRAACQLELAVRLCAKLIVFFILNVKDLTYY